MSMSRQLEHLYDIKHVMFDTEAPNGQHSVTTRKVGYHTQENGIRVVACREHGAMFCVALLKKIKGRIYRCPTCNEGAVAVRK